MNNLAPVVLFVYNRPEHTKKTLDALSKNKFADKTDLIIYADAAKNENSIKNVIQVRHIIRQYSSCFASVKIVERNTNCGLAKNIIEGVTQVVNEYGQVIVLEDDIVTSPAFLEFMNSALAEYKNSERVWHISGWNYPINADGLPDVFFWRTMNCWGWATWADRWQHFTKNPQQLVQSWSKDEIDHFNLDGKYNFWSQVTANLQGKLNTWAIFWYATIFKKNGLCLNPTKSYVTNIGNDGTGENCGTTDPYQAQLAAKNVTIWPDTMMENALAVSRIKAFYRSITPPLYRRVLGKLKRILLK